MGVVDMSTSRGHNFCIRSLFGVLDTQLERSNREERFFTSPKLKYPKKRRLGPQNGPRSLEPKKLPRWKTIFRASGIGGWPAISTWINNM